MFLGCATGGENKLKIWIVKFKFIFPNKITKEINEGTKVKSTIRFWIKKIPTLVYNCCQWWQRYRSQIIKSENYMVGITQNKQTNALFSLWS